MSGTRQVVFISGEAGIGKTTLADAFAEHARGGTALWYGCGQCLDQRGPGEAYMPVLEALSRMCRGAAGEDLIDFLARFAPTWLVQMPWLLNGNKIEGLQHAVLGATRDRMLREIVESIEILRRCWSGPLDPRIHHSKKGFNSRAVIDACRPFEWLKDFPPVAESSPELREKVYNKYKKLIEG